MEEFFIRVEETDPVVNLIVCFAVVAFNDSYHKYVKEHRSKNITQAVPLVCECYKSISRHCFYVTLDAIEQWKPGGDAKRSYYLESTPFDKNVRSFHQESEYEKG
nr:LRR receptor-like serine/threonine-protein kinase [Tanacetum cinerariifolium]